MNTSPIPERLKTHASSAKLLAGVAIAFVFAIHSAPAAAQTVIVRSAPAGSKIEMTWNNGAPASATADNFGDATLSVPARTGETDVELRVDACGTSVRVLVLERGRQPAAPEPGCTRTDVWGIYVMRSVTTFVVDMEGTAATVFVRQGPAPPEWVRRGPPPPKPWGEPRSGFQLFTAAGFSSLDTPLAVVCGDSATCNGSNTSGGVTLGAAYWFTKWAGAQVSYVNRATANISGGGDTYKFSNALKMKIVTIDGLFGVPAGPVRFYMRGGLNHHESTLTGNETIGQSTQQFGLKRTGVSWQLGGGLEAWASRFAAVYLELQRAKIDGAPEGGGEGALKDNALQFFFGVRVRIIGK